MRSSRLYLTPLLLFALCTVGTGCGEEGETETNDPADAAADTKQRAADADAGSNDTAPPREDTAEDTEEADTAMKSDGDAAAPRFRSGEVRLIQIETPSGPGYRAAATFTEAPETGKGSCTRSEQNGCRLIECEKRNNGSALAVSAGDIAIEGGSSTVELSPNSDGTYNPARGMEHVFDGSQTLTVEAAGATVPAFSETLEPPRAEATVSSPTYPERGAPMEVDTSSDMQVQWETSELDGGSFIAVLSAQDQNQRTDIVCRWDATRGEATIPASLLENLLKSSGIYAFEYGASTSFEAGVFPLSVVAGTTQDDGDPETAGGLGEAVFQ